MMLSPVAEEQLVAELVRAWPRERPLAVVWEGGGGAGPRSIVAEAGESLCVWDGAGALERLSGALADCADARAEWPRGWIGYLSYDLGRVIEPAVERGGGERARVDRAWPLVEMFRVERGVVVDHDTGGVEGFGGFALGELSRGARRSPSEQAGAFRVGEFSRTSSREEYVERAARVVEHIRAGDVFQVNLAHRLSAPFEGSAREAFVRLALRAGPRHGAYVESAGRAVLSVSPELFLDVDLGARRVLTRPMKGTRPAHVDVRELEDSAKDRAELNMIIDLMRNDLGRIAEPGSVRATEMRRIERHAGPRGVWQATGTVEARLRGGPRDGVGWAELLRATFAPGSVTGAPKIRAMRIIDQLEPVRRGPYCGAMGWIGDSGRGRLNVAIRTALVSGAGAGPGLISGGVLDYSVGAGVVAESEPALEWEETLAKASVLDAIHRS